MPRRLLGQFILPGGIAPPKKLVPLWKFSFRNPPPLEKWSKQLSQVSLSYNCHRRQKYCYWQNRKEQLGRKEIDSLAENNQKAQKCRNRTWPAFPFSFIFCQFFCQNQSVFSHFCLVSAIFAYFLPFLPVFESSFSNFCSMLRLAEHYDRKEWYISLAEQNCRIWPPLRGYFLAEQD